MDGPRDRRKGEREKEGDKAGGRDAGTVPGIKVHVWQIFAQ